jgi:hypothetical protein
MTLLVAPGTQSDEVLVRVIAEQAARPNVMNLESTLEPAMLAAPPVSLQHSFVQYLVRPLIEPQPGTFRGRTDHKTQRTNRIVTTGLDTNPETKISLTTLNRCKNLEYE